MKLRPMKLQIDEGFCTEVSQAPSTLVQLVPVQRVRPLSQDTKCRLCNAAGGLLVHPMARLKLTKLGYRDMS